MAGEDVGGALTGQVDPATASTQWDDYLNRPGNRQALLQMGLQLMQPTAIGQTTGGAIAQSIGAGAEAVGRAQESDLKDRLAEAKMANAEEKLRISQQMADSGAIRAGAAASRASQRTVKGGITEIFRAQQAAKKEAQFEKDLNRDAENIAEQAKDEFNLKAGDPVVKEYKGLTVPQIREKLRATRTPPPSSDVNPGVFDEGGDNTDVAPTAPAGFTKYSDGKFYKPDPSNPGKVLRWKP